jgi:acetylglutamate kinase
LAQNLIPVVSTIGADLSGQSYNINADTVAGAIAGALGATKVIYLTDIAGLLRDVDDQSSLIAQTTPSEIAGLIADGVHVAPTMAVLLQRLAPQQVVLVSDALAPYGLADGLYRWDERTLVVKSAGTMPP